MTASKFIVQGWRAGKYNNLWFGYDRERAIIQATKSYNIRNHKIIRVIEIKSEQIEIYRWKNDD
jgi:hypothetical protein